MSFRSGSNTNFVLNNLKVNGTLTLENELSIPNLDVSGDTSLNNLEVSGDTQLNDLTVDGDTQLNDLTVDGDTQLNDLEVNGSTNLLGLTSAVDLQVASNLTCEGELDVNGNVKANNTIITPQQLSYVSGATSNIQTQLNGKAGTANPTFTGVTSTATSESTGFAYFGNDGTALPTFNSSNRYGGIGANMTGGHGEMDFVNTGYDATNTTLSAFDWYMMTSASAHTMLMRLYHSGELWISGLLNAVGGITTSTLTATGHSQLADVSLNNMAITGNLNVTGQITNGTPGTDPVYMITSATPGNIEILYYNLTGNTGSPNVTMQLAQNYANTTNYAVFPSFYYNYSGSSGTYNINGTSGTLTELIWSNRTASSFTWTLNKGTSDNVNVYVVFLVVYGVSNSGFPNSY